MTAICSGAWAASGFPLAVDVQWLNSRVASRLVAAKRVDASHRHRGALQRRSGTRVVSDARAYHLWLELPEHLRVESFASSQPPWNSGHAGLRVHRRTRICSKRSLTGA